MQSRCPFMEGFWRALANTISSGATDDFAETIFRENELNVPSSEEDTQRRMDSAMFAAFSLLLRYHTDFDSEDFRRLPPFVLNKPLNDKFVKRVRDKMGRIEESIRLNVIEMKLAGGPLSGANRRVMMLESVADMLNLFENKEAKQLGLQFSHFLSAIVLVPEHEVHAWGVNLKKLRPTPRKEWRNYHE